MAPIELPALLGLDECDQIIRWSEAEGYVDFLPNPDAPADHARCPTNEHLDVRVLQRLADRLYDAFPGTVDGFSRPPLLFRFERGQRLLPGASSPPEADESAWILVLCLSDASGAETVCYPASGPVAGARSCGDALLFPACLTSEESPARLGRRYILRGEVTLRLAAPAGG